MSTSEYNTLSSYLALVTSRNFARHVVSGDNIVDYNLIRKGFYGFIHVRRPTFALSYEIAAETWPPQRQGQHIH